MFFVLISSFLDRSFQIRVIPAFIAVTRCQGSATSRVTRDQRSGFSAYIATTSSLGELCEISCFIHSSLRYKLMFYACQRIPDTCPSLDKHPV
jgi:hypothetical protein